jgi:hypothetical protein
VTRRPGGSIWGSVLVLLGVALLIAGGFGGILGVRWLFSALSLSEADLAGLLAPGMVGGIVVGGVGALLLIVGSAELFFLARSTAAGGPRSPFGGVRPMFVSLCVLATIVGGVVYVAVVGGVSWVFGLVLPDWLTTLVSLVLTLGGLPFVGPVAYQLFSGRRADEVPGGRPMPGWVYRVRRRRKASP